MVLRDTEHRDVFIELLKLPKFSYTGKQMSEWSGLDPSKISRFLNKQRDLKAGEFRRLLSSMPREFREEYPISFSNVPPAKTSQASLLTHLDELAAIKARELLEAAIKHSRTLSNTLASAKAHKAMGMHPELDALGPGSWMSPHESLPTINSHESYSNDSLLDLSYTARVRLSNWLKAASRNYGKTNTQFGELCCRGNKECTLLYASLLRVNQEVKFTRDSLLPFIAYLPQVLGWRDENPIVDEMEKYQGTVEDLIELLELEEIPHRFVNR
ncbi:MAG: hypothetical protein F6K36_04290 [Symploca sp. SIO3C6]|uniref:Uncharacterized protein n=1 Tax=Symploca sp. SIO1C4 TaxID=2607765 RepID=A0A6B3NKZ0_9CYAN|nr:hypothetical protein [Symploca sp. SIO3C6]NER29908.1 hypothetical protein [Symploca sp. SIO1C4]